jgi:hypothetical protein
MLDDDDFNELDRKTPLQRYGLPVGGAIVIVVAGMSIYALLRGNTGPAPRPHNETHITQVQLPPPPPPPPPPKTPPPPKKPEETPKQREATPQKAVSKPAPKAPSPPAAVTTSIQGAGPGSLAVGNGGGGYCIGTGCGSGDGTGGDNDAYYSNLVKSQLEDALRHNEKLKFAKYQLVIAFSLDSTGHPVGAVVKSFSGDDDLRAEVERVVRSASTGDTPAASIVGREFTVRIVERARG